MNDIQRMSHRGLALAKNLQDAAIEIYSILSTLEKDTDEQGQALSDSARTTNELRLRDLIGAWAK